MPSDVTPAPSLVICFLQLQISENDITIKIILNIFRFIYWFIFIHLQALVLSKTCLVVSFGIVRWQSVMLLWKPNLVYFKNLQVCWYGWLSLYLFGRLLGFLDLVYNLCGVDTFLLILMCIPTLIPGRFWSEKTSTPNLYL